LLRLTLIDVLLGSIPMVGAWSVSKWMIPWADKIKPAMRWPDWEFVGVFGTSAAGRPAREKLGANPRCWRSTKSRHESIRLYPGFMKPPQPAALRHFGTTLRVWLWAGTLGCAALASAADGATATNSRVSYVAYQFDPDEGWRTWTAGNGGATRLDGRVWHYDFTRGASSVRLSLPDRSLLTRPECFRLRVRGEAKGHPVRVAIPTHFMTFHKTVGEFTGSGEQELVFAAPPGEGWQWSGGENDGRIHGPLRLGSISLEANGVTNSGALELLGFAVEGQCPSNKLCVITAETIANEHAFGFRVRARSLASAAVSATLRWTVQDWDRHVLASGGQAVELMPGGVVQRVAVPLPQLPPPLRFAEATFTLDAPGQAVAPVQAYWLAPVPPREDVRLLPDSPFGMGVYLCRFGGRDLEAVARKARDAGVKWSREDFSWSRIEPRPGEFHWDYYDQLLDTARRNGITVYAIVGYWTSWSKNYTSEGVDQYVAFLRQLVRRYKDRIQQWEIWNEPNIFFWQGPKELYAEMLKKSYAAVKEEDPGAQVLGISTAGIDFGFIDKMLQLGTPFDVLTIHPYRKQLDDAAFIADLRRVSNQVKLPDGTRRPVWLTELGWATHTPHHVLRQDFEPVTQRVQAELIARTYLCSIVSGVEPRTFWYNFRNDGDDPFYFEHTLGTLHHDGRPKPAYLAYATLASVLDAMRYDRPIEAGGDVFAHRFVSSRADGREVIAVWHPRSDATVELKLPAGNVRVINAVGENADHQTQAAPTAPAMRLLRLPLRAGAPAYVLSGG
jgi:hypothetical protein